MSSEGEAKEKTETREATKVGKKVDISKLVSIIPPPSELWKREVRVREKRIRIRWDEATPEDSVKVPKELARMLGINKGDMVEIVVAGRHKFVYKAIIIEEGGVNEVYCHPAKLREHGVADNSIATIRRHGVR